MIQNSGHFFRSGDPEETFDTRATRPRRSLRGPTILGWALMMGGLGCGASLQYVPSSTADFHPRVQLDQVQVLQDPPSRDHDILGTLYWDYYGPEFRAPTLLDASNELRAKAFEQGADALIIRRQALVSAGHGVLRIVADVIRYKERPVKSKRVRRRSLIAHAGSTLSWWPAGASASSATR